MFVVRFSVIYDLDLDLDLILLKVDLGVSRGTGVRRQSVFGVASQLHMMPISAAAVSRR